MLRQKPYHTGAPLPRRPPTTLDGDVDSSLFALWQSLCEYIAARGVAVGPADSLQGALQTVAAGECISLLPDLHEFASILTVENPVRLEAIGRVRLSSASGSVLRLDSPGVGAFLIVGMEFSSNVLVVAGTKASFIGCTWTGTAHIDNTLGALADVSVNGGVGSGTPHVNAGLFGEV